MGGGIGRILGELAEREAPKLEESFSETLSRKWDAYGRILRSGEAEGNKSESGKLFIDMLKDYSTNMRRDSETYAQGTQQPLPPRRIFAGKAYKEQRQQIGKRNLQNLETANSIARGINDEHIFGPDRVRLSQVIKLAGQERNVIHAENLADIASVFLKEPTPKLYRMGGELTDWRKAAGIKSGSPYTAKRPDSIETDFKKFSSISFLGRVVIPHAFQHLNVMFSEGFRPYFKAVSQFLSSASREEADQFAIESGSMWEESHRQAMDAAEGRDTVWSKVYNMPLFNLVRKWEIIHSANAGKFASEWATRDFLKTGSKASRIQLEMLGLDADKIAEQGGLTHEDKLTAGFRSADENLFIERGLKTPWVWEEGAASRVLSLYKQYQFREGKFAKDALVRSFKSSPLNFIKTVAILGTAYPIAGELINAFDNLVTGRPIFDKGHPLFGMLRKPLEQVTGHRFEVGKSNVMKASSLMRMHGRWANYTDEYFDALGHMAVFGIWYGAMRNALTNREADWMEGPVFGTAIDIEKAGRQSLKKRSIKPLVKYGVRRIPVIGPLAVEELKKKHKL